MSQDVMGRDLISSGSPYEGPIGFSRAVKIGNAIAVSGTAPIDDDGSTVHPGDAYGQTLRCLNIIKQAVQQAGGRLEDIIRTRVFLTDVSIWQTVGKVHGEFFGSIRPACTFVVVQGLLSPDWLVEIEADCVLSPAHQFDTQRQVEMSNQSQQPAASTMKHLGLEDQVWQAVQLLNHAWTVEGNTEKLREYFHKDMVAITATDRERLEGREACIASWKRFVETAKIHHWHVTSPKIKLYGDNNAAVVTYYYDMSVDVDGQTKKVGGRDMFVLVNENGRWWVVANQFSDNPSE